MQIKKRYSLRFLFVIVTIAAFGCLLLKQYLERRVDYVVPPIIGEIPFTPTEFEALRLDQIARLKSEFPSRGLEYWQAQAAKVKPGMTIYALWKYLPPVVSGGSYLNIDNDGPWTQSIYYAVDAEFAVLCEVKYNDKYSVLYGMIRENPRESFLRVVRMIEIFPHNLELDDMGALQILESRPKAQKVSGTFD